jgi:hypothetical protein
MRLQPSTVIANSPDPSCIQELARFRPFAAFGFVVFVTDERVEVDEVFASARFAFAESVDVACPLFAVAEVEADCTAVLSFTPVLAALVFACPRLAFVFRVGSFDAGVVGEDVVSRASCSVTTGASTARLFTGFRFGFVVCSFPERRYCLNVRALT